MSRKKNKVWHIDLPKKVRVRRMPKVNEINMGTDIVPSTRPELTEEDYKPTQCINGHWTTIGDLDKDNHCSQCPVEVEKDELDAAEDELSDALDYLHKEEDYYDDGKDG